MALPMVSLFFRRHSHVFANRVTGKVRVRFAPSPTGQLHLGGLRTALFNFLFAKANNGSFLLRIEDTDLTRKVPGATEKLEQMLSWAGLIPDESPSAGGDLGPYIQSQRIQLYHDNIEMLLKSGHCYRCFCTSKRLALIRKEAARRQEVPRYDNKCRHLTDEEIEEKLSQNVPHVIRFKYEPLSGPWYDLVYGVKHEAAVGEALEGDFIVMKTDGYPTYHFANVVDDHYMNISHVLRGEEWSISTPKHLQMYSAFGWEPPQFAHLPLILNSDGTKLSKRQGDIQVEMFRDKNIEPDALLNYLTTVNRGFTESTDGKTLQEMVDTFSLELVNTHSSRLQPYKLPNLNRKHLQRQFHSGKKQLLVDRMKNILQLHYGDKLSNEHVLQDDYISPIISWALEHRITQLEDLTGELFEFIWIMPSLQNIMAVSNSNRECEIILERTADKLKELDSFSEHVLKDVFKQFCKDNDIKMREYMGILRNSLSELQEGPAVSEMMEMLGKQETLRRLEFVLQTLRNTDRNS